MNKQPSKEPDATKRLGLASLLVALRPQRGPATSAEAGNAARALQPDTSPEELVESDESQSTGVATILDAARSAMRRAKDALLQRQKDDGHWIYEFEADCTIPAEYIIFMHHMGDINTSLQAKMAPAIKPG